MPKPHTRCARCPGAPARMEPGSSIAQEGTMTPPVPAGTARSITDGGSATGMLTTWPAEFLRHNRPPGPSRGRPRPRSLRRGAPKGGLRYEHRYTLAGLGRLACNGGGYLIHGAATREPSQRMGSSNGSRDCRSSRRDPTPTCRALLSGDRAVPARARRRWPSQHLAATLQPQLVRGGYQLVIDHSSLLPSSWNQDPGFAAFNADPVRRHRPR